MEYGTIKPIEITQEMRSAYLDYAMSVIVARALPDVRDGLKPVQRRIIYVMDQLNLQHTAPYKKSARIVGDTLGRYHPHGDAAVYDAMVRLAQDFSMRYPLVDGQGNFGSVDGDPPAAQRYTEARLAAIAEEMLHDIEKQTVDFAPNFDGTLEEPMVLPAGLPNLLLNGAAGIAVGMATNIPPHNLGELCAAISLLIDNPEAGVEELMAVMPGPDFPTGGIILGQEGIRTAYSTGKGRFVVRAKAHIEEATRGRYNIILTELPYQVNKARLLERIADLVKQERLNDISDLRDESDRTGMRVVITLKREAQAETVLNQLFKYTQMQVTFGVNLLALVDGTQPRVLTLKRMLQHYITYRQEVIIRRTRYDLDKARQRAHILEGLLIALDFLDEVIETIRRSQTADTAKVNLMRRFKLTEIQAQAILDLQLRRLAALERKKIEEEYKEIKLKIAELEAILANPRKVLDLIQADLNALRARYGDARRTRITDEEAGEITAADLIPDVEVLVSVTERSFIRRLPLETYRRQSRGTRGQVRTREQDAVVHAVVANTKDDLLLFSDRGKCYQIKAHQLPDAERDPKGLALSNLISVDAQERITGVVPVRDLEAAEFIVLATRGGKIKRSELGEFRQVRSSGLVAMGLDKGDALVGARRTQGGEEIVIVTEAGQAIRFGQEDLRPMGRSAGGVRAIALAAKDRVIAMDVVRVPEDALLTMAVDGYGKRAPLAEYPVHGRGGKGVSTAKSGQRLADARVVGPKDEVTLITAKGVVVRLPAEGIAQRARATRGDRVVELDAGDTVVALGVILGEEPGAVPPPPPEKSPARRRAASKSAAEKKAAPARRKKAAPAAKKAPAAVARARKETPAAVEPPPPAEEKPAPTRRRRAQPAAKKTPAPAARSRKKTPAAVAPPPLAEEKPAPTARTRKKAPEAAVQAAVEVPPAADEKAAPPTGRRGAAARKQPALSAARQMTLDEAVPPPPVEEEGPPLIIRRMGRILGPEDEESSRPSRPARSRAAEAPREERELVIRQLSQDPTFEPPSRQPVSAEKRTAAPAAERPAARRPAAAKKTTAAPAAEKTSTAPATRKKPTARKGEAAAAPATRQRPAKGKETVAAPATRKKPATRGSEPAVVPATRQRPAKAKETSAAPATRKKPATRGSEPAVVPAARQRPAPKKQPPTPTAGKKPPAAPTARKKPATEKRAAPAPVAGKKPAATPRPASAPAARKKAPPAPAAGKKPTSRKRTDVGISTVLSGPVPARATRSKKPREEPPTADSQRTTSDSRRKDVADREPQKPGPPGARTRKR